MNIGENYAVVIMHDILEGLVQYETRLLFEYLAFASGPVKILSLEMLDFSEDIAAFHQLYFKASRKVCKMSWS